MTLAFLKLYIALWIIITPLVWEYFWQDGLAQSVTWKIVVVSNFVVFTSLRYTGSLGAENDSYLFKAITFASEN